MHFMEVGIMLVALLSKVQRLIMVLHMISSLEWKTYQMKVHQFPRLLLPQSRHQSHSLLVTLVLTIQHGQASLTRLTHVSMSLRILQTAAGGKTAMASVPLKHVLQVVMKNVLRHQ